MDLDELAMELSEELEKLVNRSGFLFQMSVENHVRETSSEHGWEILASEYPWAAPDAAKSGFVDFIAGRSGLRCVVECKRTQDGK